MTQEEKEAGLEKLYNEAMKINAGELKKRRYNIEAWFTTIKRT